MSKSIEIGVDALRRCLANTSCVLHPPATAQPTSGAGASAGTAQMAKSILQVATLATLTEATAREAAEACQKYLGGKADDPCGGSSSVRILFEGGFDLPEQADHAADAIADHSDWTQLTRMKPGYWPRWYRYRQTCVDANRDGKACDEYPFRTTKEGGPDHATSLRGVHPLESSWQGTVINLFYTGCKVQNEVKFYVIPVTARTVPSFAVCRP